MNRRVRKLSPVALAAVILLAACSDDPEGPDLTTADLVGEYAAEAGVAGAVFSTTEAGETVDWLTRGGSLTITLEATNTTEGHLFVPEAEEDGSDFEANLAGTWTLSGDTVRFSHNADTFVRDMPFVYRDGRLEGERTFDETLVRVVLVKR